MASAYMVLALGLCVDVGTFAPPRSHTLRRRDLLRGYRGDARMEQTVSLFDPSSGGSDMWNMMEEAMIAQHLGQHKEQECHELFAPCPADDEEFWEDVELAIDSLDATESELRRFAHFCFIHRMISLPLTGRTRTEAAAVMHFGPIKEFLDGRQRVAALSYYPALKTAQPFHNIDSMQWLSELKSSAHVINQELSACSGFLEERWNKAWSGSYDTYGWEQITLSTNFHRNNDNIAMFPKTMELLKTLSVPFGPRHVAIARQSAHSGIPPHSDFQNWMLTAHLVLRGPAEGCGIQVDGIDAPWIPGEAIVIDTTFEHKTWNTNSEHCYILLIDFWHPDLSAVEVEALRSFLRLDELYIKRKNVDLSSLGSGDHRAHSQAAVALDIGV